MSVYKSSESIIKEVEINFHIPKIISLKLREQASQFVKFIADDIIALNRDISLYQTSPCLENLQKIEERLSFVINKYPDNVVALFPEYLHVMHGILYDSIKQEKKRLSAEDSFQSQTAPSNFIKIIEEISADSFADLLKLFANKYASHDLLEQDLYKLAKKNIKLSYLIDNYAIKYIDGNNGKVFQLTHLETGESFIVRYGNRLNNPRNLEVDLVTEFKEVAFNPLPPLLGARQGSYKDKHGNLNVCFLEVMPCYPQSLATQQIKPKDADSCMLFACDICLQLGQTLQFMQAKGFMHADLKPCNILLEYDKKTKAYHIKLMDRKSILRTDEGIYSPDLPANFWYDKPLTTAAISAPELDTYEKINADKVHAYAVGINLFLAIIRPETYARIKGQFFARGASGLHTIVSQCTEDFPGENGRALMDLILKATQHDPYDPVERIGVDEVVIELQKIQQNIENKLRDSCKFGIIELKKMIPMFQDTALREEFVSIIREIEQELDNPKQFTLSTLEQLIYSGMGDILSNALSAHVNANFDNQLKENPFIANVVQRAIVKAKTVREVQEVIDLAENIESLCQQLPIFNSCKSLIVKLKKQKYLDVEIEDNLDYLENKLKGLFNIIFDKVSAEDIDTAFASIMSDVLEVKLKIFLSAHFKLDHLQKMPELQKELDMKIEKARPFQSEMQVEIFCNDLIKFNAKIFHQVIQEKKNLPDIEDSNQRNNDFGYKY